MLRTRFLDFRVAAAATPWSMPVGMCSTDLPGLAALANLIQERLIKDPMAPDEGWWGGWARMAFNVMPPSFNLVTPRGVARIILMDLCKKPIFIRNEFYEFLQFGRGFQPEGCNSGCGQHLQTYEREVVPTLSELSAPSYVRVYPTNNADVGKTVIIQGQDQNDKEVLAIDPQTGAATLGESITIVSPFATSTNVFKTVEAVQKDVTFGEVQLYQVNASTSVETPLSAMEPGEITGAYRKYFINGISRTCCSQDPIQVLAMCKLDHVPVVSDQDYLRIQCLPAMLQEGQAIRMEAMENGNAQQLAVGHHAKALSLLNGELDHFLGKERTAIKVPIAGSQRIRPSFA